MADPHIITALRSKRAELSGELGVAESRVQRIQAEIAAVDTTLRLFDPNQRPATIRPVVKRSKPSRFRQGELTRTILGLLRESPTPMSVRELAAAIAVSHGLDVSTRAAMETLLNNVRAAISKRREGVAREEVDGVYRWRAA